MTTRAPVRRWTATGDAGVKETLAFMRNLVNEAVADPAFVWWSRSVVDPCPDNDAACCAAAIRAYARAHVRFTRDPVGVENITPPLEHMRRLEGGGTVRGDCDDVATLTAALGMSVGLPARFVALAFPRQVRGVREYDERNAPYGHVYTLLNAAGKWREMDTTRPAQPNASPVRALTFDV